MDWRIYIGYPLGLWATLLSSASLGLDRPRIVFSPRGIQYVGLFRHWLYGNRFYEWSEVGAFRVDTVLYHGIWKQVFLNSHSDPERDDWSGLGPIEVAYWTNRRTHVRLDIFESGKDAQWAKELADHLNRMRKAYG